MIAFSDLVITLFLIVNFSLASASRLLHCIRLVALQGLLLAVLPFALWDGNGGVPHWELILVSLLGLAVKCVLLPFLLTRTTRKTGIGRELEPLVDYSLSLFLLLAFSGVVFFLCRQVNLEPARSLVLPSALVTVATGLLLIVARRKAITQALGFLCFENGISLFGTGMMLKYGMLVELGILLDVLVLVFVMGIAVFRIQHEFSHIDSDRLNLLRDDVSGENAEDKTI